MPKGVYKLPNITNEPIKSYAPGSPERAALKEKLNGTHIYLDKVSVGAPGFSSGQKMRSIIR